MLPPLREDAGQRPQPAPDNRDHPNQRRIGRFLVSPLVKTAADGWFATSVSIRSGSGSASTDRVLRLTRLFRCAKEATLYAHAEALRWITSSHSPLPA